MRRVNRKAILIAGVVAILILLALKSNLIQYQEREETDLRSWSYLPDTTARFNDELRVAQQKVDSLKMAKKSIIDDHAFFNGFTLGPFGVGMLSTRGQTTPDNHEFIKFTYVGLQLNEQIGKHYFSFYTKNGQGFTSKLKITTKNHLSKVSYIHRPVSYKYLSGENSVLVPVKSKFVSILVSLISLVILVISGAAMLFLGFTFFKFLFAIARNEAFEQGNVQRIKDMSVVFFALSILPWLLNYLSYLIFKFNYSSDGIQFTYSFLEHESTFLIFAILAYIIYTAFNNAMIMQKENELTI